MKKSIFAASLLVFFLISVFYKGNNLKTYGKGEEEKSLNSYKLCEYNDEDLISLSSSDGVTDETWYGIGTSLPHPVNYSNSDLLKFLKPGDLIFERAGSYGYSGHSAIVEGIFYDSRYNQEYIRIIEAMPEYNVSRGLLTPNRFDDRKTSVSRLTGASEEQINGIIDFCISQLNKPYNVSHYMDSSPDSPNWYCSELIWAALKSQGMDFHHGSFYVCPEDIHIYSGATLVMHYEYQTEIVEIDSTEHEFFCSLPSYSIKEKHNFVFYNNCYETCRTCNYKKQIKEHNYQYVWLNYRQHNSMCDCGYIKSEGHAVSINYIKPGQKYPICMICNGPASVGFINTASIYTSSSSKNGSYILSNGVVVLVDADVEAYLNGTLKFDYQNILIEKDNLITLLR